ncbi:hypothetical protein A2926_03255 [Candidatus Giovannonibacteria bacterium RIFCSPLOWO2_01_FULL_44_40]|uniref:Uncharacterized protein n=1 Tax=Candidatus Giovannonibacteria bacterium RIFCSPHIGHO2_01_FULL_45_23 TaxID=1798325 RepID=A0A1F5VF58_9BACT|nr:MAG: hypothetical protein A2834_01965 [Candidatus Giovannonibacteria bacterium RIFCSPHIGHO2_01_FULL_45_23]OGF75069.1 MAG: hypothetical protein A3C77_04070 [Candidatus Giovannonibacteria bacterium RIFCSPHIGHO2_02_FULL_45_13]OGF80181.1 MAG: hypothetical protein A2926_03255 [Candidatus Giovannonibacteria bacterium RIFCSPLOWO2_01_FULL_44_40]
MVLMKKAGVKSYLLLSILLGGLLFFATRVLKIETRNDKANLSLSLGKSIAQASHNQCNLPGAYQNTGS